MYYGRNVYFLNPHYREIRTMGGRTNRGPGVQQSWKLYVLLPIGISNPKTKLVLLEKGLNCQHNLSIGGLNKKRPK